MLMKNLEQKKVFFPNHFFGKIRNFSPSKENLIFSIFLTSIPILNTLFFFSSIKESFGPEELMNAEETVLEKTSLLYPENLFLIFIVLIFKLFKNFKISRAYIIMNYQQKIFSKFYRICDFWENISETKFGFFSDKLKSVFFFLNLILPNDTGKLVRENYKLGNYNFPSMFFFRKIFTDTLNFFLDFSKKKKGSLFGLKLEFLTSIFRNFKKRKFRRIVVKSSIFFYIFTKPIKHPKNYKNCIHPMLGENKRTPGDPCSFQKILYPKKYYRTLLEMAHWKKFSQIFFPDTFLSPFFLKNELFGSPGKLRIAIIRVYKKAKKNNLSENFQKKNEISFLKSLQNKEYKRFEVTRPLLRPNNFGFFVSRISFIIKFKENL